MNFDMGRGYSFDDDKCMVFHHDTPMLAIRGVRAKVLVELLRKDKGDITSKKELMMAIWGKNDITIFSSALTQQIYLLRKDVEKIGLTNYILSQSREGYYINKVDADDSLASASHGVSRLIKNRKIPSPHHIYISVIIFLQLSLLYLQLAMHS